LFSRRWWEWRIQHDWSDQRQQWFVVFVGIKKCTRLQDSMNLYEIIIIIISCTMKMKKETPLCPFVTSANSNSATVTVTLTHTHTHTHTTHSMNNECLSLFFVLSCSTGVYTHFPLPWTQTYLGLLNSPTLKHTTFLRNFSPHSLATG
jgi:hypothetical protein